MNKNIFEYIFKMYVLQSIFWAIFGGFLAKEYLNTAGICATSVHFAMRFYECIRII